MSDSPPLSRRHFLAGSAASGIAGTALATQSTDASPQLPAARPTFISTWRFGAPANELALKTYQEQGSMLDAIEKGIGLVEADVSNASVGIGGIPNAEGVVQVDACIMSGPDHDAGSVAGVEDILHPISVARKVMEETRHVMLVGDGAKSFALDQGYSTTPLLTDSQKTKWEKWKEKQSVPEIDEQNHDTIAMIGVDSEGNVFGGCSTSGWGYKVPGRVGDSPIIGSGLYVDNEVGGAGATGIGENVMRYCASFMIVEAMRQGLSPQEACEATIERIVRKDSKNAEELAINFIAVNRDGEIGAAGTSKGFQYSVTTAQGTRVDNAKALTDAEIIEGGNR